MRLIWSPRAVDALAEAVRYIAAENPGAATRWAEGLLEALDRLERFPHSGRMVPEPESGKIESLRMTSAQRIMLHVRSRPEKDDQCRG